MFERFTDRARKVMALAGQEALRLNHEYIGTEHVLLGLINEGQGVGAGTLRKLGLDLSQVRAEVERLARPGPDMLIAGALPHTPRVHKMIEFAVEEARELGHNYVGTEHLLLGLLRVNDGVAALVLSNLQIDMESCRREVLTIVGTDGPEPYALSAGRRIRNLTVEIQHRIKLLEREMKHAVEREQDEAADALLARIEEARDSLEQVERDLTTILARLG